MIYCLPMAVQIPRIRAQSKPSYPVWLVRVAPDGPSIIFPITLSLN